MLQLGVGVSAFYCSRACDPVFAIGRFLRQFQSGRCYGVLHSKNIEGSQLNVNYLLVVLDRSLEVRMRCNNSNN